MIHKLLSSLTSFMLLFIMPATLLAAPFLPAPSNVRAVTTSQTQISLSWQDNAGNETGFKIERGIDGTTFAEIASVNANVIAYSDTGLSSNTKYFYRVRAFKIKNYSAYSNISSARTLQYPPAAPSDLAATLGISTGTSTPVTLTWADNSDNESGFTIQRSADGINFGNLGFISPNYTSFIDLVANGATYYYRVKAVNSGGSSAYSNIASVIVP